MSRRLRIEGEIKDKLVAALGGEQVDISKYAVFSTVALSQAPLRKRAGLYEKARFTRTTLSEMADYIAAGNTVPMHTLHMQGAELPIGQVFMAWVEDDDDGASLYANFYVDPSEEQIISKLDNGTIGEVSVGVLPKKILCSECGFDYLSDEADFDNIWERTCNEGHTIGKDGVHASIAGLDMWMELSLVSVGASPDAKIQKRVAAQLGQDRLERLAASGLPPQALIVRASMKSEPAKPTTKAKEGKSMPDVDLSQFIGELAEVKVELKLSQTKVGELETALKTKDDRIAELEAQAAEAPKSETDSENLAEIEAEMKAASEELDAAKKFLQEQAKAALVAAGTETDVEKMTAAELIASIEEAKVKLHQMIPAEPVSASITMDADKPRRRDFSAFKSRAR